MKKTTTTIALRGSSALTRFVVVATLVELELEPNEIIVANAPGRCPGCGAAPEDGATIGCNHHLGCGWVRNAERSASDSEAPLPIAPCRR